MVGVKAFDERTHTLVQAFKPFGEGRFDLGFYHSAVNHGKLALFGIHYAISQNGISRINT